MHPRDAWDPTPWLSPAAKRTGTRLLAPILAYALVGIVALLGFAGVSSTLFSIATVGLTGVERVCAGSGATVDAADAALLAFASLVVAINVGSVAAVLALANVTPPASVARGLLAVAATLTAATLVAHGALLACAHRADGDAPNELHWIILAAEAAVAVVVGAVAACV
jgi:hypothetical protein